MENYGIIYKITNPINGKCYIGQTTQGIKQRRAEHYARLAGGRRDHKLYRAFTKYGIENFVWELIDTASCKESLDTKEKYYISCYGSYYRGYNATDGGFSLSEETRNKIRDKMLGRNITWGWKTRATRIARNNYGTTINPSGADSPNAKQYIVTEPDGTEHFVCGLNAWCKAWTKEKLYTGALVYCAKGVYKTSKGYKCRYADVEPSTTIPKGSTPQAMAVEMGDTPTGVKI